MAIWDGIKRQLRSVIEWENASQENLMEIWSENGDELKNASQLIVKPGQGVIFVYQGKIEAIHTEEGLYNLETDNIPFITTLTKFMQAFESEHKVGIYFFWQTHFLNQKWGTSSPIKYDDPVYKFPVELRAYGNFTFRITKPEYLFVNIVGGRSEFGVDETRQVITERFVQPLTDLLAESGLSYAEIDKNRMELAEKLTESLSPDMDKLGLELTDFRIEGTTFDEGTQERIARIADMTAEAEAAKRAGLNYAQLQQLEALRDAAKNEGGLAGAGVGLGAGIGLGNAFTQGMVGAGGQMLAPGQQPAAGQAPAGQAPAGQAAAPAADDPTARLAKLKSMLDQELISQEEFDKKKAEILSEL